MDNLFLFRLVSIAFLIWLAVVRAMDIILGEAVFVHCFFLFLQWISRSTYQRTRKRGQRTRGGRGECVRGHRFV